MEADEIAEVLKKLDKGEILEKWENVDWVTVTKNDDGKIKVSLKTVDQDAGRPVDTESFALHKPPKVCILVLHKPIIDGDQPSTELICGASVEEIISDIEAQTKYFLEHLREVK